jgi:hypothetical protein
MLQSELIAIVVVILLVVMVTLRTSSRMDYAYSSQSYNNLRHTNLRHTNIDGERAADQSIPSPWTYEAGRSPQEISDYQPPQFMGARYKVIAEDGMGDETEPLDDMINQRIFKNPVFEKSCKEGFPDTSQTFWNSTKSTPTIAHDDKQLIHSSAEMQTPEFRVKMSGKAKKFLPYSGGRSRLNFTSFEHSNSEPEFRQ